MTGCFVSHGVTTCIATTFTKLYAATATAIGTAWNGHTKPPVVPPSA